MNRRLGLMFLTMVAFLTITASAALATPYCHACPFTCESLDLGHKDCSQVRSTSDSCCVDLTQKGLDRTQSYDAGARASPGWQHERQVTCPVGFRPSEQKCSSEERRRGCKDIRLNSGLGCVNR